MKTMVLHGSPRKHGDSDTLADSFLSGLQAQGECQVAHFYANELNIRPCQGCLKCNHRLEGYCATQDDMQQIYSAFVESELVVFATPMYWGYMTAQLKTVMDRMEAICGYFKGKTFVVLITYHYHCASTVAFFERITPFFGVKLHVITCRTMDEKTEADIPIQAIPEKLAEAEQLGRMVRASVN
jgi:multimeric flavodoxin WrbA